MGVKADVFLRCLTTLVLGGNGLSRPGGNLGFRVQGLRFKIKCLGLNVRGLGFKV